MQTKKFELKKSWEWYCVYVWHLLNPIHTPKQASLFLPVASSSTFLIIWLKFIHIYDIYEYDSTLTLHKYEAKLSFLYHSLIWWLSVLTAAESLHLFMHHLHVWSVPVISAKEVFGCLLAWLSQHWVEEWNQTGLCEGMYLGTFSTLLVEV